MSTGTAFEVERAAVRDQLRAARLNRGLAYTDLSLLCCQAVLTGTRTLPVSVTYLRRAPSYRAALNPATAECALHDYGQCGT